MLRHQQKDLSDEDIALEELPCCYQIMTLPYNSAYSSEEPTPFCGSPENDNPVLNTYTAAMFTTGH